MTDFFDKQYGVYIHIPFCKAKCNYCAFVSTPDMSLQRAYVNALIDEISKSAARGSRVDTIYVGGGTPSCLYGWALSDIISAVYDTFSVDSNAEITVEINPESCTREFAAECAACGVNRVSMGLQSSDDKILKAIGRLHDRSGFLRAAEILRAKFDNISTDIILGLPEQTAADIETAVNIASDFCAHVSVYALTVENGTKLCADGYAPDDDKTADLYDCAFRLLNDRGYKRYEVSNFALSGRQSRHNGKYWACLPYLGFGVAAHGYDGEYVRCRHSDDIASYIADREVFLTRLSDKDRFNEYVMLRLRTENGIDRQNFRRRFGFDIAEKKGKEIARLCADGYIIADDCSVKIAPEYMFVMNGIIESLMLD
ncbi:MAG: radical SAM family heme chaperone HemW [Roseburia sp.]|nr:radical SAM family heme chaperone HemW [Roseburia sp.]